MKTSKRIIDDLKERGLVAAKKGQESFALWACVNIHCLEHGHALVGHDYYAENGTPVCVECDREMEFVREYRKR